MVNQDPMRKQKINYPSTAKGKFLVLFLGPKILTLSKVNWLELIYSEMVKYDT